MAGPAILKIEVLSDATPAQQGFSDVDSSARNAAKGVDSLGEAFDKADRKSQSMSDVADRVDDVGGKSQKTASGLNDLAGVFDLIGAGAFGEQMGVVSTVMEAGAGAADLFTVAQLAGAAAVKAVGSSAAFATIKTLAYNVASKAVAVATGIWTAAQWLLNIALNANPIGLVVAIILVLIAVIILVVKNFDKIKAVSLIVWTAIRDAIAAAWRWLKANVFDKIGAAAAAVVTAFKSMWSWIKDLWGRIVALLSDNVIVDMVKGVIGWIEKLVGWIQKVKLPDWLTNLNPFSASAQVSQSYVFRHHPAAIPSRMGAAALTGSTVSMAARTAAATPVVVNVILDGKRVGGYVDRIITARLNEEGFALAAGVWGAV